MSSSSARAATHPHIHTAPLTNDPVQEKVKKYNFEFYLHLARCSVGARPLPPPRRNSAGWCVETIDAGLYTRRYGPKTGSGSSTESTIRAAKREPAASWQTLPKEIHLMILSHLLVADGPITNPWMDHSNGGTNSDHPQYRWSAGFEINVFSVNKEFHRMATELLYRRNTFRFVRQVATQSDTVNRCITLGLNTLAQFIIFMKQSTRVYLENGRAEGWTRADLITDMLIQDSDLDSDSLAARGHGRVLSDIHYDPEGEDKCESLSWTTLVICILARSSCRLLRLTISIDEQDPILMRNLMEKSEGTQVETLGPVRYRRRVRPLNEAFNFLPERFIRLGVLNLIVRGTTSRVDDARRSKSLGTVTVELLEKYLSLRGVLARNVKYSGTLTKRVLAYNGEIIPELVAAEDASSPSNEASDDGEAEGQEDPDAMTHDDSTVAQGANEGALTSNIETITEPMVEDKEDNDSYDGEMVAQIISQTCQAREILREFVAPQQYHHHRELLRRPQLVSNATEYRTVQALVDPAQDLFGEPWDIYKLESRFEL